MFNLEKYSNEHKVFTKVAIWFTSSIAASLAFILTIIPGILSLLDKKWIEVVSHNTVTSIALVSLVINFSIAVCIVRFYKTIVSEPEGYQVGQKHLSDELLQSVQVAFEKEKWNEVVKVGKILSRPLWILGKYQLRYDIGKLVEMSAAQISDFEAQANALIDDLGWTAYELGKHDLAIDNIKHGISIATNYNYFLIASKAYRHLSGIYLSNNQQKDSEDALSTSEVYANKIDDEKQRAEALTGCLTNRAIILMNKGEYGTSIDAFLQAKENYKKTNDKDREAKLYHYIGDAYLKWGRKNEAYDAYRQGLSYSEREGRRDGVYRNSYGIATISMSKGDKETAKSMLIKARDAAIQLCNAEAQTEIETKLQSLSLSTTKI